MDPVKVLTVVMEKSALLNYKKIFSNLNGILFGPRVIHCVNLYFICRQGCAHTGRWWWLDKYNHLLGRVSSSGGGQG